MPPKYLKEKEESLFDNVDFYFTWNRIIKPVHERQRNGKKKEKH
jgi:hypothetical protein